MIQTVTIQDWLPTMSANGSHGHWSKARKAHDIDRDTAWASAKHACWQRFDGKVRVTITLYFAQQRRRDLDNLYYRCKGTIDGIKDFCVDDDAEHMELVVAAQLALTGGRKATEIVMETIE
jgi:Holliday junction resolvase RusA-like endonuclease